MKKYLKLVLLLLLYVQSLNAGASGLSAFGDVLVWKISEQPSSVWANAIELNDKLAVIGYTPYNINFGWSSGFKTGLFYEPESAFWDTKLTWTYYPTNKSANIPVGANLLASNFFSGFLAEDVFFGGDINWQFVMNTLDLEASHQLNLTKSFSIRPAIGIKGATINQTATAQWDAVLYNAHEKVTNNFTGAGPSFGLDANWNFYHNFSLNGDLSTALMWGRWKLNDIYSKPAVLGTPPLNVTTTMNNAQLGILMMDAFMGLEWFYRGRSQVDFKLGYEMQYWANQLRMPTFLILPVRGDLTLQGITCGLTIKF